MPEIRTIKRVTPQEIHVVNVQTDVARPMSIKTAVIHVDGDPYEGPYEVTPKITAQTLDTHDKHMKDDVTVLEIPYYETSHQDGLTVYIGNSI